MKQSAALSLAFAAIMAIAVATPSSVRAQNGPGSEGAGKATSGTAPEHMGNSGWTGGSPGTTDGMSPGHTSERPGSINDDTHYATGVDLKGPAVTFPPSKTPE
jgi:hypothetical protein